MLADINSKALNYAAANAAINDVPQAEIAYSDILDGIEGPIDVVLANPPYLVDEGERLYRHGGENSEFPFPSASSSKAWRGSILAGASLFTPEHRSSTAPILF